jgi:signal peptidase I
VSDEVREPSAKTSSVATTKPVKSKRSFWVELPIMLVIAVALAFGVRAYVVQTFYIPSASMEQTLLVNDKVLANKLVYRFRDPHRGEVIVFTPPPTWQPEADQKHFIKRVIGIAGDRVVCCDSGGRVTVNGQPLTEPYIYPGNAAATGPFDVVVPPGRLFVMGDHRSDSLDSSRHLEFDSGTIAVSSVLGRAFAIFWPLGRIDVLPVPTTFATVPAPVAASPHPHPARPEGARPSPPVSSHRTVKPS